MRLALALAFLAAILGCSKAKEPQPTSQEVRASVKNIREQERALAHAQAEERNESAAEALNEVDQDVQNVRD